MMVLQRREAEHVFNRVVAALEEALLGNLDVDECSIKLNSLGKFTVRHREEHSRKNPFNRGEVIKVPLKRKIKFVTLGELRAQQNSSPPLDNARPHSTEKTIQPNGPFLTCTSQL